MDILSDILAELDAGQLGEVLLNFFRSVDEKQSQSLLRQLFENTVARAACGLGLRRDAGDLATRADETGGGSAQ